MKVEQFGAGINFNGLYFDEYAMKSRFVDFITYSQNWHALARVHYHCDINFCKNESVVYNRLVRVPPRAKG